MKKHQLSVSDWHQRYSIQASWTAAIRSKLYALLDLNDTSGVLEVGSGTGLIIGELSSRFRSQTYGLDIDAEANAFASACNPQTDYLTGDGMLLPFPQSIFDATLCHFLLMWIPTPEVVISEMTRVTRPGGWVLALAEPDYGGRIDYPDDLAELGKLQTQALANQGTDPNIGRRLRDLFYRAKLTQVQVGVLGGEWIDTPSTDELESEWRTLASDLNDTLSEKALAAFRQADLEAWHNGRRILYVPTFYACGRVARA